VHSACVIFQSWNGYYHYTSEIFFLVAACREQFESDSKFMFVINSKAANLSIAQFALLNIPRDRIIVVGGHESVTFIRVLNLYIPSFSGCGHQSKGLASATRQWVIDSNHNVYTKKNKKNILVLERRSISKVCKRCLVNTDDLVEATRKHLPDYNIMVLRVSPDVSQMTWGETIRYLYDVNSVDKKISWWETAKFLFGYYPADDKQLSMQETMEVFANASIIVGPHGAAFTNMIFSRNAALIEFPIGGQYNSCFLNLAVALNLRFYSAGFDKHFPNNANITDYLIMLDLAINNK
jgi:hypothetical protein